MSSKMWAIDLDATLEKNPDFPKVWKDVRFILVRPVDGGYFLDKDVIGVGKVEGMIVGCYSASESLDMVHTQQFLDDVNKNIGHQAYELPSDEDYDVRTSMD